MTEAPSSLIIFYHFTSIFPLLNPVPVTWSADASFLAEPGVILEIQLASLEQNKIKGWNSHNAAGIWK